MVLYFKIYLLEADLTYIDYDIRRGVYEGGFYYYFKNLRFFSSVLLAK